MCKGTETHVIPWRVRYAGEKGRAGSDRTFMEADFILTELGGP